MAACDAPECKPKANEKPTTAEPSAATDEKKPLSALRGSLPLPYATYQDFLDIKKIWEPRSPGDL